MLLGLQVEIFLHYLFVLYQIVLELIGHLRNLEIRQQT